MAAIPSQSEFLKLKAADVAAAEKKKLLLAANKEAARLLLLSVTGFSTGAQQEMKVRIK